MNAPAIAFAGLLAMAQMPRLSISMERDTISVGEKGYVMGPPMHIAGPAQFHVAWSPDGRFLSAVSAQVDPSDRLKLALGDKVPIQVSVLVRESATGTCRTLMTQRAPGVVAPVGWLPKSSALFIVQQWVEPSGPTRNEPVAMTAVYRWRPGDVQPTKMGNFGYSQVSDAQPYARLLNDLNDGPVAVAEGRPAKEVIPSDYWFVGPAGNPWKVSLQAVDLQQDADGFFDAMTPLPTLVNGKRQFGWTRINPDGTTQKLPGEPRFEHRPGDWVETDNGAVQIPDAAHDPNDIQAILSRTEISQGSIKTKVQSGWLWAADKGQLRATLVAAEADQIALSPDRKAVAYVSRENLMVRSIQPISAKDLDKMLEESEKKDLMDRAKQVGTAMMIYASDYDDRMPPSANWQDILNPYAKNKSLFDGFNYDMNGELLTSIAEPADKRMGYVDGKYGRAIVFSDGHVIWERRRQP